MRRCKMSEKDDIKRDDGLVVDDDRDEELMNEPDEFDLETATPEEIALELVNAFAEGDEERARELIKHQAIHTVANIINKEGDE